MGTKNKRTSQNDGSTSIVKTATPCTTLFWFKPAANSIKIACTDCTWKTQKTPLEIVGDRGWGWPNGDAVVHDFMKNQYGAAVVAGAAVCDM